MADVARPAYLVLVTDDPFADPSGPAQPRAVSVVRDAEVFCELLPILRPSVAVVSVPPATPEHEAQAIVERRRRPTLRIVHLSPPAESARRLAALRAGFDDALPSTIGTAELLDRMRILEERSHVRQPNLLRVTDDVVLDLVAHEVRRDGDLVHLRPKEFQLLAMLAAHPGRAYTRRQLLDRVWGREHDGDPRTVDVHVRWLRSKIEPVPDAPVHLVTVRGVGYRLDPDPR